MTFRAVIAGLFGGLLVLSGLFFFKHYFYGDKAILAPSATQDAKTAEVAQSIYPSMEADWALHKIEAPLAEYMEEVDEEELISVVLIMDRQISNEEKARLFDRIDETERAQKSDEKRRTLINDLKRISRADQSLIANYLHDLESAQVVAQVRPLWIVNVIGVKAPKDIIRRLTAFRNIDSIHLDIPRPVKGANAWGVDQVRADQVWNLAPTGYTGDGVIVGILDTGVDYNHSDLSDRMWINTAEDIDGDMTFTAADNNGIDDDGNGFIDDVIGWNFSGTGNNDPIDAQGHGTHVAGTVAGDGTGGTITGVAPAAQIMALRESNTIALSTEQECWAGMQYALDNGADIVNFSSGWLDSWFPAYNTWRTAVNNLMDGGVLFVTIAHNDSNTTGSPNNVRTPGRVPLAVTVGATDNADAIGLFSNNGPVTWQTVAPSFDYPWPPGLLKPDVTAPGVDVNSTVLGGGYSGDTWNGTSMAAPHAAGVAALLLEKDPTLSPYELKFLLEETALELGAAGPDNVYGWGRVDALDAANYVIDSTNYDLSVTGTSAVWANSDIWVDNDDDGSPDTPVALTNNHLYARIRNTGGEVVSNVEVKFYYADVSTLGISGFDPNGDGDPADGNFTYIGSYRVPTLGPAGSDHAEAIALANWSIPVPTGDHWCVGIGIVADSPPNTVEVDTSNNSGFKNFFNIITSSSTFAFNIQPLPQNLSAPFGVEILKRNLPQEAIVELIVDKNYEERLFARNEGFSRVKEPLLNDSMKPMGEEYFKVLENEIPDARYRIDSDRAVLRQIVSPKGEPFPVKLLVTIPEEVKAHEEMTIIINTIDMEGRAIGGIGLNVIH